MNFPATRDKVRTEGGCNDNGKANRNSQLLHVSGSTFEFVDIFLPLHPFFLASPVLSYFPNYKVPRHSEERIKVSREDEEKGKTVEFL